MRRELTNLVTLWRHGLERTSSESRCSPEIVTAGVQIRRRSPCSVAAVNTRSTRASRESPLRRPDLHAGLRLELARESRGGARRGARRALRFAPCCARELGLISRPRARLRAVHDPTTLNCIDSSRSSLRAGLGSPLAAAAPLRLRISDRGRSCRPKGGPRRPRAGNYASLCTLVRRLVGSSQRPHCLALPDSSAILAGLQARAPTRRRCWPRPGFRSRIVGSGAPTAARESSSSLVASRLDVHGRLRLFGRMWRRSIPPGRARCPRLPTSRVSTPRSANAWRACRAATCAS